jgi:hypothetical protein
MAVQTKKGGGKTVRQRECVIGCTSHVFIPTILNWVWLRLCGHFLHFLFTASPLDLLPPTPFPFCCFRRSLPSSDEGCFSPQPPLCLCLRCYPVYAWPLSFSCFQASRLPPCLPQSTAPVLLPRPPQHHTPRESGVSHPLSRLHFIAHVLGLQHDGRHLVWLRAVVAGGDGRVCLDGECGCRITPAQLNDGHA